MVTVTNAPQVPSALRLQPPNSMPSLLLNDNHGAPATAVQCIRPRPALAMRNLAVVVVSPRQSSAIVLEASNNTEGTAIPDTAMACVPACELRVTVALKGPA